MKSIRDFMSVTRSDGHEFFVSSCSVLKRDCVTEGLDRRIILEDLKKFTGFRILCGC